MLTYALILGGLVFLIAGGEALIRGSVALGNRFHLSPLFMGIVIVGFGTSTPELVVSVDATLSGNPAIAVGNVVGSNIANILLILAIAALIFPIPKSNRSIMPDGLILMLVMIGIVLVGLQGRIPAWQGAIMIGLLIAYVYSEYRRVKSETLAQKALEESAAKEAEKQSLPLALALVFIVAGLVALILGADWFVEGAVQLAKQFGVSEAVIGLTIVAVGTSLPELASSVIAALRKHSEVAYGNVFGSNLYNVLGILGASSIVGPLAFPWEMVIIDGLVMIATTFVMLFFLATGRGISRTEGILMLIAYVAYVVFRAGYGAV